MNRRQVLLSSSALIAALAGCSSESNPASTPASTSTTTAEPTATTTARPTTEEPTEEPTPTETAEPTDTPEPTETEEPTPTDEDIAAGRIDKARNKFRQALKVYVGRSDENNPTIVDIDASGYFNFTDITNLLRKGDQKLDNAKSKASQSQLTTIQKLRGVSLYLSSAARTQHHLSLIYEEFRKAHQSIMEGGSVRAEVININNELPEVDKHLKTINSKCESSDFDAFEAMSGSVMVEKTDQLKFERKSLNQSTSIFEEFHSLIEEYESAESDMWQDEYNSAMLGARDVEDGFEDLIEVIEDSEFAPSTEEVFEELIAEANKWIREAEELAETAAERADSS